MCVGYVWVKKKIVINKLNGYDHGHKPKKWLLTKNKEQNIDLIQPIKSVKRESISIFFSRHIKYERNWSVVDSGSEGWVKPQKKEEKN